MSVDLQETHAIGNRAEQFIAGGMSGNLINLRKAIDVEEYERTAGSAGLRVVVERFEQLVTIEQTGERIVGREKQYRAMRFAGIHTDGDRAGDVAILDHQREHVTVKRDTAEVGLERTMSSAQCAAQRT